MTLFFSMVAVLRSVFSNVSKKEVKEMIKDSENSTRKILRSEIGQVNVKYEERTKQILNKMNDVVKLNTELVKRFDAHIDKQEKQTG